MRDAILIRKFKAEDKAQLLEILTENTPKYFAESEIADYANYLEKEIQDYFIAQLDDKIIAGAGINYDKEKHLAKISWDIVSPAFHKQGIGSLLLAHRLQHISMKKDIKNIIVRTSQLAHQFYLKKGFKLLETHKDYWAKGFDMYKMIYNK